MDPAIGNLVMILCFVIGSGLMVLEAFMPGFGIAGGFGIVLEIAALVLTWMNHGITAALIALFGVLLLIGLVVWCSYRSAMKGRLSKSPLILKDQENPVPKAAQGKWLNQKGVAITPLRPAGTVEIDGQRLSATSTGAFLAKGTAVTVIGREGGQLLVQPVSHKGKAD